MKKGEKNTLKMRPKKLLREPNNLRTKCNLKEAKK
jgi:hypothetical protein